METLCGVLIKSTFKINQATFNDRLRTVTPGNNGWSYGCFYYNGKGTAFASPRHYFPFIR